MPLGGIKELLADVEVKNVDISNEVGRWASGTFISGTTTWVGTAAFTVLIGMIKVTAGAAGAVTMGTTADADAVFKCTSTVAGSYCSTGIALAAAGAAQFATAVNTTLQEFAAKQPLVISAATTVKGKFYFLYIKTPT